MVGVIQGDQDVSFQDMNTKTNEFIRIVKQDPAVQNVLAFVGGNAAQNQGRMFVTLKPLAERKISVDQVIARLRPKLSHIPGATLYFQGVQDLQIGGRQSNAQFQYTLSGENLNELYEWAPKLLQRLRKIPQLKDVNSDQQISGLEANVIVDRDTAARLGITPSQIDNILYDAFGQRQISTIYRTLNQYHVVLEVDPKYQLTPDALNSVYVITNSGAQVPLSSFAHFGAGEHFALGQSPGTVPCGDHLVQSGAGRGPGNGHAARSTRQNWRCAFRRPSTAASREPRPRFRIR